MKLLVRLERKGPDTAEADAAVAAAKAHLEAVLERGPEITETAQRLRGIQEDLVMQGRFREVIYSALAAEVEAGAWGELIQNGRNFSWELTQRKG